MASEGRGARLPDDLLSTLAHQQNCSLAGEGHVALEEAFSAFSQNFQRTCVISQTPGDDARDGGNTGSARGAAAAIIFAASLFGGEPAQPQTLPVAGCASNAHAERISFFSGDLAVMLPLIAGTRGIDLSSHMMLLLKAFSAGIMLGLAQVSAGHNYSERSVLGSFLRRLLPAPDHLAGGRRPKASSPVCLQIALRGRASPSEAFTRPVPRLLPPLVRRFTSSRTHMLTWRNPREPCTTTTTSLASS